MVTIYDTSGNARFSTPINGGSKRVFQLMGDDYVILVFSVAAPVPFVLGDYCDLEGFGRYELVEPYKPEYNASTGGWDYELKLEAQHMKWRNKIMRFLPQIGAAECTFTLTTTPDVHLAQVLANINALVDEPDISGTVVRQNPLYLYNGTTRYALGDIRSDVELTAKTISYDKVNILDALTSIAETYDTEWWIDGNLIYLGKCVDGDETKLDEETILAKYIDLEIGDNVANITPNDSTETLATRIIPYGGTRNISPHYRRKLIFDVKSIEGTGPWRISDTARVLSADWFNADTTETNSNPSDKFVATHQFSFSGTYSSRNNETLILYTDTNEIGALESGEWTIGLSALKVRYSWSDKVGAIGSGVFTFRIKGTKGTSGEAYSYEYTYNLAIPKDSGSTAIAIPDITVKIEDNLVDVSTEIEVALNMPGLTGFWSSMRSEPTINFSFDTMQGGDIAFQYGEDRSRVANVRIEVLDEDGNVTRTIEGCIFNPDYATGQTARNWLLLPDGVYPNDVGLGTGARFMLPDLILSKVKSSYFSSKYALYKNLSDIVTSGVVTTHLMLPESYGKSYIDAKELDALQEAVEDVVVFEDIYPKMVNTVKSVSTAERKETVENDDDTETNQTYLAYILKDFFWTKDNLFSLDYMIDGKDLQITFKDGYKYTEDDIYPRSAERPNARGGYLEFVDDNGDPIPVREGAKVGELHNPNGGKLNGWTFDVDWGKESDGTSTWEIRRDDNALVPSIIIHPEPFDQFVLTGMDTSIVDEVYTTEAEEELLTKAKQYVAEINLDASTYDCEMMPDAIANGLHLQLGTRVNLFYDGTITPTVDTKGRRWGRKSRVIGFEIPLDVPYDSPTYTIGNKPSYSRFGEIEDNIEALTHVMASSSTATTATVTTSNGLSYIITTSDTTPPTDTNVFSALRSKADFCLKAVVETIKATWKFAAGLIVGEYYKGQRGASIDADGNAEFESATIRNDAEIGGILTAKGDADIKGDTAIGGNATIGGNTTTPLLTSPKFNAAMLGGYGFRAEIDENDKARIYTDYLTVREGMSVAKLIIEEINSVDGGIVVSRAHGEVKNPKYWDYTKDTATDRVIGVSVSLKGKVNKFAKGDIVHWSNWNQSLGDEDFVDTDGTYALRSGWMVVGNPEAGTDTEGSPIIYLRAINGYLTDEEVACLPQEDDVLVQMGHMAYEEASEDPTRQGFVFISPNSSGDLGVSVYAGVNSTSFSDKLKARMGYLGGITDEVLGVLSGYGLYGTDVFLTGKFVVKSSNGDPSELQTVLESIFEVNNGLTSKITSVTDSYSNGQGRNLLLATNQGVTNWTTGSNISAISISSKTIAQADMTSNIYGGAAESKLYAQFIRADLGTTLESGTSAYEYLAYKIRPELIQPGQTYTLSFLSQVDFINFEARICDLTSANRLVTPSSVKRTWIAGNYSRYTVTLQALDADNIAAYGNQWLMLAFPSESIGAWSGIRIWDLKLEAGTLQTMWTAAPEDYADTLDAVTKKAISEIKQTAEDITLRVSSVEETANANTEAIAELKITAEGLTSTVKKNTEYITNSGLGRNLLLATDSGSDGWVGSSDSITMITSDIQVADYATTPCIATAGLGLMADRQGTATWCYFSYHLRPELIKSGQKYTLSFWIYPDAAISIQGTIGKVTGAPYLTDSATSETLVANTAQRVELTLTASANGTESGGQRVMLYVKGGINAWNDIKIWGLKLEEGSTATAWSAAPEDYTDDTAATLRSEIKQTASEISLKVFSDCSSAGLTIGANKVVIDADKVEISNNGTTAALFDNGAINADLIRSSKFEAIDSDNYTRTTINDSGDGAVEIYYPTASKTKALEIGPENIITADGTTIMTIMRYYDEDGALIWWLSPSGLKQADYYTWLAYQFASEDVVSDSKWSTETVGYYTRYVVQSTSSATDGNGNTYASLNGDVHTDYRLSSSLVSDGTYYAPNAVPHLQAMSVANGDPYYPYGSPYYTREYYVVSGGKLTEEGKIYFFTNGTQFDPDDYQQTS